MEKINFNEIVKKIKNFKLNIKLLINNNRIKLSKRNNFENATIIFSRTRLNYESLMDILHFKRIVKNFLITLSQNCKNFNPNLFLQNFSITNFDINIPYQKAKFISNNTLEKGESVSGLCNFSKDKISYYFEDFSAAYHELLHLASYKVKNGMLFAGFELKNGQTRFGRGLNEGYTQFLSKRYFGNKSLTAYKLEVAIIEVLEIIVGKDKMEELYFNANVSGLIKEIEKYADENNVKGFIVDLDDLYDCECLFHKYNKYSKEREYIIQSLFSKIYLFLFKCLKHKVFSFDETNLNSENIQDMMFLLNKNNWIGTINLNNHDFSLLGEEDYNSYLNASEISAKKVS